MEAAKRTEHRVWRRIGLSLLVAFGAGALTTAQQDPTAAAKPATRARSASPSDAIVVHGHWLIDVRNPDGTLASHHDFQNALLPTGQQLLAYLISKGSAILTWDIRLRTNGVDQTGPCAPTQGGDSSCYIAGPGSTLPAVMAGAPNVFATGAFARTAAGTLEITGNATATSAQSIGYVESMAEATGLPLQPFSARTLATPIQVAAGQQLFVKVIVSFGATEPDGGGGGGGGGLDSDGDGIPDTVDQCPQVQNLSLGTASYCPTTIYGLTKPAGVVFVSYFPKTNDRVFVPSLHVTQATANTITVALLPSDPGYLSEVNGLPVESIYSQVVVQLNGAAPPAVGALVNVYGTLLSITTMSADAVQVTGTGGGGGLDSDGDGVPDATDPCPMDPSVPINGVVYCPTSLYNAMNGSVPANSVGAFLNLTVTAVSTGTFTVAVLPGDVNYQGDDYSSAIVQLNGLTAPAIGSVVNLYATVVTPGAGAIRDPNTFEVITPYVPGVLSAASIVVVAAP